MERYENGQLVGKGEAFSFPVDLNHALAEAFTYNIGFDPNSVSMALQAVRWHGGRGGSEGAIINGQSTAVPFPGPLTVTIDLVVVTTEE